MTTRNIYDLAQTWNNGATDFTAIKMNVTDTASAATSKLLDLQVGGSSQFSVSKAGWLQAKSITAGSLYGCIFGQTGLYYMIFGGNTDGLTLSSARFLGFSSAGFNMTAASADTRLHRDAANTLALRNGVNAQAFNIYNTYTDASNYERGCIKWSSNVLTIGTEAAGTGVGRNIAITRNGSNVLVASFGQVSLYGTIVAYGKLRGSNMYIEYPEVSGASVSAETNYAKVYAEDNGAGKTRLMVQFQTGAAQQIAIEP